MPRDLLRVLHEDKRTTLSSNGFENLYYFPQYNLHIEAVRTDYRG